MKTSSTDIRNIAIYRPRRPWQDHAVDAMLNQSGIFGQHEEHMERMMDSNELERERGITILSKITGIRLPRRQDQHRRHARPQRFPGRGGARAQMVDGSCCWWTPARPAAADALTCW